MKVGEGKGNDDYFLVLEVGGSQKPANISAC